jgi:hypothetical protein
MGWRERWALKAKVRGEEKLSLRLPLLLVLCPPPTHKRNFPSFLVSVIVVSLHIMIMTKREREGANEDDDDNRQSLDEKCNDKRRNA